MFSCFFISYTGNISKRSVFCAGVLSLFLISVTNYRVFSLFRAVKASHVLVSSDGRVCLSGLRYCYSMWNGYNRVKALHNFPAHAVAVLPWIAPEILDQVYKGVHKIAYISKAEHDILSTLSNCSLVDSALPYFPLFNHMLLYCLEMGLKCVVGDSFCREAPKIFLITPNLYCHIVCFFVESCWLHRKVRHLQFWYPCLRANNWQNTVLRNVCNAGIFSILLLHYNE